MSYLYVTSKTKNLFNMRTSIIIKTYGFNESRERKISNTSKINYDRNVSIIQHSEPKNMHKCKYVFCWHVHWRLHVATARVSNWISFPNHLCINNVLYNHKIEAYYFLILSAFLFVSFLSSMSGVKLPINDLRRCRRIHCINVHRYRQDLVLLL